MKKKIALVGLAIVGFAALGCGNKSSEESAGDSVKQLPATAPVTSEAQKTAQAEVAKDPKAETPRADGDRGTKTGP